jgi:chemotaxis signal transduction protein
VQLLTFSMNDRRYGIDTRRVVEVLPLVIARPLPRQPDEVLGVIRYRGQFLPSIDLGQIIAGRRCSDRLSTRTVVVQLAVENAAHMEPLLALVAEDVIGIMAAASPPPEQPTTAGPFGPLVELAGKAGSSEAAQLLAIDSIMPEPQLTTLLGLAGSQPGLPTTESKTIEPS